MCVGSMYRYKISRHRHRLSHLGMKITLDLLTHLLYTVLHQLMKGNKMIAWEDLPEVEKLAATYYDLYKDAHGVRPRWIYNDRGECLYSEQEMKDMLDRLHTDAQAIWDEEAREEAERVAAFEAKLVELQKTGAADREAAIQWYLQSLELATWVLEYGGEHVCYELGLPYKMAPQFDPVRQAILNQMDANKEAASLQQW